MGREGRQTAIGGERPFRLGILGTRRGIAFAEAARLLGVEVAAFCGRDARRLKMIAQMFPGARTLTSYDDMLSDESIDGIVVANYATEHAPAVCRALKAGKHVLSEVPAFLTIAEAVELIRTVESTGMTYAFGENFCFLAFVQEMRRLYRSGELGELTYAEGEYVHDARDALHRLIDVAIPHHWRTWIPPTFYNTHSLGPIVHVTGLRPTHVQAATGLIGGGEGRLPKQTPAIEVVRLENGAVVKSLHGGAYPRAPWQPWYLIAGTSGYVENSRIPDVNEVTLYRRTDDCPKRYVARYPRLAEEAAKAQHWGADLFTLLDFVEAAQSGRPPAIDVYTAVDISLVGTLAWRSILGGGRWIEIPDLRDPEVRRSWENDHCSTAPDAREEHRLPNHVMSDATVLPSEESLAEIRRKQENEPYHRSIYRD